MSTVAAFGMVEMAVKEVIESGYAPAAGNVGGDLSYNGQPLYVYISQVPGGGGNDENGGEWVIDVDCFAPSYAEAMRAALDLEPVILARRHVTDEMRLDRAYQNEPPVERPWADESSFRVGATYVFSARRTG